ncbi:hypothetical protein KCU65_g98, partial [Aureobasidium melanogenum]
MDNTENDSNIDKRALAMQHRAVLVEDELSVWAPELVERGSKLSGSRRERVAGCSITKHSCELGTHDQGTTLDETSALCIVEEHVFVLAASSNYSAFDSAINVGVDVQEHVCLREVGLSRRGTATGLDSKLQLLYIGLSDVRGLVGKVQKLSKAVEVDWGIRTPELIVGIWDARVYKVTTLLLPPQYDRTTYKLVEQN